jgi:hypothetical protein
MKNLPRARIETNINKVPGHPFRASRAETGTNRAAARAVEKTTKESP